MATEKKVASDLIGKPIRYDALAGYQDGSIVSRTIIDKSVGTVTVFAFDEGQRLSTHSAPYDALLQVVDGTGIITIEGNEHALSAPEAIIMPADKPHSVYAQERFKMVLTLIRA